MYILCKSGLNYRLFSPTRNEAHQTHIMVSVLSSLTVFLALTNCFRKILVTSYVLL